MFWLQVIQKQFTPTWLLSEFIKNKKVKRRSHICLHKTDVAPRRPTSLWRNDDFIRPARPTNPTLLHTRPCQAARESASDRFSCASISMHCIYSMSACIGFATTRKMTAADVLCRLKGWTWIWQSTTTWPTCQLTKVGIQPPAPAATRRNRMCFLG